MIQTSVLAVSHRIMIELKCHHFWTYLEIKAERSSAAIIKKKVMPLSLLHPTTPCYSPSTSQVHLADLKNFLWYSWNFPDVSPLEDIFLFPASECSFIFTNFLSYGKSLKVLFLEETGFHEYPGQSYECI